MKNKRGGSVYLIVVIKAAAICIFCGENYENIKQNLGFLLILFKENVFQHTSKNSKILEMNNCCFEHISSGGKRKI